MKNLQSFKTLNERASFKNIPIRYFDEVRKDMLVRRRDIGMQDMLRIRYRFRGPRLARVWGRPPVRDFKHHTMKADAVTFAIYVDLKPEPEFHDFYCTRCEHTYEALQKSRGIGCLKCKGK